MNKSGQPERHTQDRVLKLLEKGMGYEYLGNWELGERTSPIEEDLLRKYLDGKYSPILINKAIAELSKAAITQGRNLFEANKEVYSMLRYGVKVKEDVGGLNETVQLINWKEPLSNHFGVAEEVSVKGEFKKRPDIVLYVNGIALGVIELKSSIVSVSNGIRQNLDNQREEFIQPFFATIQLVMAGNDPEGLRYGVIDTKEKYYLTWKEADPAKYGHLLDSNITKLCEQQISLLDKHIVQCCYRSRLLEIIHDFIVYDRGIKKACRPNQYFGVLAAQEFIARREGGIIWHTQGSGKSLTMVWLARWIRENVENSRILIITDRDELDKQIEKVFKGVDEDIYRTRNGADLMRKLNEARPLVMCSLVHKFGRKEEADDTDYDNYLDELKRNIPLDFKAKGDIFVFVDECHRTQSGKLHKAMKGILPNAMLIGFTGTPLMKKDKQTSLEVFGQYIHTYKFDEAIKDKVVLDLRYEARNIDQRITSPAKIDQWFDSKTKGLTDYARAKLKEKWGTMQKVLSSQSRLEKIVADILLDLETNERLQNGRGNAMLVSGSIYQACKYYELFQKSGLKKCAIVTSYQPSQNDLKGESTGEDALTDKLKQYEVYQKMLNGKTTEAFEDEVKKKFVDEPAQMKLLIVVDKLLTGFDAPSATYLYIDKSMRDHGLFQAICRVNRLHDESKEYGFVVDYKDLFKTLEKSIHDYTSEAFDTFDAEDVAGLLSDRLGKGKEQLLDALLQIKALCEPVAQPCGIQDYIRFFCGNVENDDDLKSTAQQRHSLYKMSYALVRAYTNLANEMEEAGFTPKEILEIKADVKHFDNLRQEIKLASRDYIDLKSYEPAMRHLIDTYIGADESEKISAFDDLSLIDMIVERGIGETVGNLPKRIRDDKDAVAEVIENNIRSLIIEEAPTNPKYFEKMSTLLDELIKERKRQAEDYALYLEKVADLARQANRKSVPVAYPSSLNTMAKRALYDNLEKDEALALTVDGAIRGTKRADWKGVFLKEREVKNAIVKLLPNAEDAERILQLAIHQKDYD